MQKIIKKVKNNKYFVVDTLEGTVYKYFKKYYTNILYNYSKKAYSLGHEFIQGNSDSFVDDLKFKSIISDKILSFARISSEYVQDRYGKKVMKTLREAYEEGISIVEIKKRLMKVNKHFQDYEAHRIARTEIQSARGRAIHENMTKLGVEKKEWVTMRDNRVRDSHARIDGEVVGIDEEFSNGLQYAGDKDGEISEWINCRCVSLPVLDL